MSYWTTWFLTLGAGCFVGAIITPDSWQAVAFGVVASLLGWINHRRGGRS